MPNEGPEFLYVPVTEEVYMRFMMDPSMATRYLEQVHAFATGNTLTEVATEQIAPPTIQPLQMIEAPVGKQKSLPFELTSMGTADVHIDINGQNIQRVCAKPHPPIKLYGLSKEFGLDVKFEIELTENKPQLTLSHDQLSDAVSIWISNPQPRTTYTLAR